MFEVILDPAEVAVGRTEYELNPNPDDAAIAVDQQGIDWGDAALHAFMADSTVGSIPVDYQMPNRVVTIPLFLGSNLSGIPGFRAAKAALQQKVALLEREGGWIKRDVGGFPLFGDVVNATCNIPDRWGEFAGVEPEVKLVLEMLPDFFGPEVVCDVQTGNSLLAIAVKAGGVNAVVTGDHPGRVRMIVKDASGNDQRGVYWGFRSRNYDGAVTAHLQYEAEDLTPLDAAVVTALAGSSGGQVVQHPNLPAGQWCPVLSTKIAASGDMTHKGSYRMLARCQSSNAVPQVRFLWAAGDITHASTNPIAPLPGSTSLYLLDLGTVRLDPPPVGTWAWQGVFQALAANQGDKLAIDKIYLQPLDEYSGRLGAIQQPPPAGVVASEDLPSNATDGGAGYGTAAWTNPTQLEKPVGQQISERASAEVSGTGVTSHYLKAQGYGFQIPTSAIILGIKVTINRGANGLGTGGLSGKGLVTDNRIRLIDDTGTILAPDKADTTSPWPYYANNAPSIDKAYGGSTDLWGQTVGFWTATKLNDPDFGVAIAATLGTTFGGFGSIADVYRVHIDVTYTMSSGLTVTSDAVIYASKTLEIRTEGEFRETGAGGTYGPVSSPIGDTARIPPSGLEGRTVQMFVKTMRGSPDEDMIDGFNDDLSTQIIFRPSFLFPT